MAPTKPQKAFCAVEYAKTMSVITVQRNFRRQFDVDPPDKNSIKRWHAQLMETGCLCKNKSTGRPRSEETVDRVRQSFVRSPQKSVRKASRELALPKSTVWDVLNKRLKFKAYKLTLVQALTENDKQLRTVFSVNMLEFMENDDFGDRIVFSDEATFHVSGRVNKHNVRIWGSASANR